MSHRRDFPASAIAIMIVAFALRVYHLDFRALWWDEGLSLFFARLNFFENAAYAVRTADINPPFYRLLLGAWLSAAGWSAFAARAFSVFAGLITVAATIRLGRKWAGWQTALIAGALAAGSPMLVYYSQEAKGYSLVAACGTLSIIVWLRAVRTTDGENLADRPEATAAAETTRARAAPFRDSAVLFSLRQLGLWLAYALALAISLGSHYITIFLIAVQAGWAVVVASRQPAVGSHQSSVVSRLSPFVRRLSFFFTALALVAAAQLPFWLLTYPKTSAAVRGETGAATGLHGPVEFFGAHWMEFAVGPGAWEKKEIAEIGDRMEIRLSWAGAAVLVTLVVVGSLQKPNLRVPISNLQPHRGTSQSQISNPQFRFLLPSLVLLPLLAGFVLNTYHEFFFPRFLLYSVPPFLLLAAMGLNELLRRSKAWRVAGVAMAALVAVAWASYLARHYADPSDPAEDWRPAAAALNGHTRANDAAIYVWNWMPGYLHAYLPPSPEPQYYLGFYTPESLAPELTAIAAKHSRVWLLDYQIDQFDVRNSAGRWLGERSALVYDQWFGNSHVALFLLADRLPAPASNAQTAQFANGLTLRWSPIQISARPGAAVGVHLEWIAPPERLSRRYTVFLHGLAADGSLAFGRDSQPVNGLRPVDTWNAGEVIRDPRGVLLPLDLPRGEYMLELGMYDTLTGEVNLTSSGRTSVVIGQLMTR